MVRSGFLFDFEVTRVDVSIRDTGGRVLGQDAAPLVPEDGCWEYRGSTNLPANTAIAVEVTATDRPGHKGSKTQAR
jgi:hypothetical protein